MEKFIGIELGGTKLQIMVGDAQLQILEKHRFRVDPSAGAAGIRHQLLQTLPPLCQKHAPMALCTGFGGPVNWQEGKTCVSHQIAGWYNFPLGQWLKEILQLPVFVENDANVAAFGEAVLGAGKGLRTVFYITLGSGVGGGLVVNGKIFHGALPGETEVGQLRLDKNNRTLEAECAGWAVDQKIRAAVLQHPESILTSLTKGHPPGGEAKHLAAALAQRDEVAQQILCSTADDLAFGLSHVVHLLHPDILILGGGLSLIGEPLRKAVTDALPHYLMEAFQPGPDVQLAQLGEDAVPLGALALAISKTNACHSPTNENNA